MPSELIPFDIKDRLIEVHGEFVMFDADVAALYGVETRAVNQAVKNNPEKFPKGYILVPDRKELVGLKSKILISNPQENKRGGSRWSPKFFTEKGLYMLATILKSERATQATLSIIETYAKVRQLKQELVALHKETNPTAQHSMMERFGKALTEIVMPDLQTEETESTLELNFIIGKLKHTVKRRRTENHDETESE